VVYSQISQDLRVWSGSAVEIVAGVSVSATEIMGFKIGNGARNKIWMEDDELEDEDEGIA
jgi:hypothetical protein